MNKRILAALLAVLLLLFSFVSCNSAEPSQTSSSCETTVSTNITTPTEVIPPSEIPTETTEESTTVETTEPTVTTPPSESTTEKEELKQPLVIDGSYFEVHFIDVGQADCMLLICEGQAMLIDAGNPEDDKIILDYLAEHNVKHLSYVVATHPHADHYGAFTRVLAQISADVIYAPFNETGVWDSRYDQFLNFVKYSMRNEVRVPEVGKEFYLGSAKITVIGPLRKDYEDVNNTSIVLRVEYGNLAFIFAGDMEGVAELDLVKAGANLEADVLKIGHHGSGSSSYYQFLRAVSPTYGVITCGRDNEYGHPHSGPLSRLRDADVTLYRTDLQGHIVCRSDDGKTLTFETQMNPNAVTNPTSTYKDTSYLPTYLYYEEKFIQY